jgi:hypothetical protein
LALTNIEAAKIDIAAVEGALRAGFAGIGEKPAARTPGAIAIAASQLRIPRRTLASRVAPGGPYERLGLKVDWEIGPDPEEPNEKLKELPRREPLWARPRGKEYALLTSAQNDTDVNRPFLDNLRAYAAHLGNTRILCAPFTYQTAMADERDRNEKKKTKQEYRWSPEIQDVLVRERTTIGSAIFCAEMNTLPTANRPLSGLATYGQSRNAIFPHAKVGLETIPAAHSDLPPIIMTTGTCTVPNYTDTKAGHKGVFHHVYGAVIAEIGSDGFTPLRHVLGMTDGSFQDFDVCIDRNGHVTTGNRIEALTYGDIHSPYLDPECAMANWGFDVESWRRTGDGMSDFLRPRYQFFHDLIDHAAISHHDEHNTLMRYKRYVAGQYLLQREIDQGARLLQETTREFSQSIVVRSNHDRWLNKWLDRCDHRKDRANALTYLEFELARHRAIAEGNAEFDIIHHALRSSKAARIDDVILLREGQGFQICQAHGGIECGDHFDLGPNGSRATPTSLARVAGKASGGDKHSPGIWDGVYIAGVSCLLRREFNRAGPSSWRQANTAAYSNGKRALVFIENGRYRT